MIFPIPVIPDCERRPFAGFNPYISDIVPIAIISFHFCDMVPLSGSTPSTESTVSFSTFSGPFYSTESTDSTEPMLSTDTTWPTSSTESTWPTDTTETLMSTDHTSGKIYSGTSGRFLCLFFCCW